MISSITRKSTFAALSRDGRRVYDGPLRMTYLPPPSAEDTHLLAFALGRRFGNAVERNRARRRLRSAFALVVDEGGMRPGAYLVGAKRDVLLTPFDDLLESIRRCGKRIELA